MCVYVCVCVCVCVSVCTCKCVCVCVYASEETTAMPTRRQELGTRADIAHRSL